MKVYRGLWLNQDDYGGKEGEIRRRTVGPLRIKITGNHNNRVGMILLGRGVEGQHLPAVLLTLKGCRLRKSAADGERDIYTGITSIPGRA
ncbi:MAG: hypothetical protein WAW37_13925 [Syntrophobacteraceae bacterium]